MKEIRAPEQKPGVPLIAYVRVHPYKKRTDAEIAKVNVAETETGTILVALYSD